MTGHHPSALCAFFFLSVTELLFPLPSSRHGFRIRTSSRSQPSSFFGWFLAALPLPLQQEQAYLKQKQPGPHHHCRGCLVCLVSLGRSGVWAFGCWVAGCRVSRTTRRPQHRAQRFETGPEGGRKVPSNHGRDPGRECAAKSCRHLMIFPTLGPGDLATPRRVQRAKSKRTCPPGTGDRGMGKLKESSGALG